MPFNGASVPHVYSGSKAAGATTNCNVAKDSETGIITGKPLKSPTWKTHVSLPFPCYWWKQTNMAVSISRKVGKGNLNHAQRRIGNFSEKHQCLPHPPFLEFCFLVSEDSCQIK